MRSLGLRIVIIVLVAYSMILDSAFAATENVSAFRDIKMAPDRDTEAEARGQMRTDAQEVAHLLKIEPLVEKLRLAKQEQGSDGQMSHTVQYARLLCLWKIFIAMEEVRKVVSVINFELSHSYQTLDALTTKRNMTINMLNTFNFMQGGILGVVSKSISFKGGNPNDGKKVSEVGFSIGTVLPPISLFLPSIFHSDINSAPNTLAHIFNKSYRPSDFNHSYLWRFMDSPIPGSSDTLKRREILIKHWEALSGLNAKNENNMNRLAAFNSGDKNMTEDIRIVAQRIDLLQDLKTHLEEFDGSLFELHEVIKVN